MLRLCSFFAQSPCAPCASRARSSVPLSVTGTCRLCSSLPTTEMSMEQPPMPQCRYEVLSGKCASAGGQVRRKGTAGVGGAPVTYARVGDSVYHQWTCDYPQPGIAYGSGSFTTTPPCRHVLHGGALVYCRRRRQGTAPGGRRQRVTFYVLSCASSNMHYSVASSTV